MKGQCSQSGAPGPAASLLPGNLGEVQILRPADPGPLGVGPQPVFIFTSPPGT